MLLKGKLRGLIFSCALVCQLYASSSPSKWPALETTAKQMLLADFQTGVVLLSKNPDQPMIPSSMTKIMTIYCIFQKLKQGSLSIETCFPVSEKAWRTEGTRMFLEPRKQVSVGDLIKGIVIQSGNDACVTVAEGLMGQEESFAELMTKEAHKLGATHSFFRNAHGLHEEGHTSTARDLWLITKHLIEDFPEYYSVHKEKEFTYNNIRQFNKNPLLYVTGIQCDGVKTGNTDAGGYGMVASVINRDQSGQRFILVINGLSSLSERALEVKRLILWAEQVYTQRTLFQPDALVAHLAVSLGQADTLPVTMEKPVIITLPRTMLEDVKAEISYHKPLTAPIKKGTVVGYLIVSIPGYEEPWKFPLISAVTVESAPFFKKIKDSLNLLIWGKT